MFELGALKEERWGRTLMGFCHEVNWQKTNDGGMS